MQSYNAHYKANIKLAYPVMLSQAGQMLVGIADNLMVGQIGKIPLAACGLANSIFPLIMVLGMGIIMALTPLVGQTYGEKNYGRVGVLYKHGLFISIAVGIVLFLISIASSPLLYQMKQTPEVVDLAIPYFGVISFSLIPLMLFFNGKQFAEGVASTRPAMVITLAFNALNILLNYLLIYGKLGMPALGLMGAGYATLISRAGMGIAMLLWVKKASMMKPFWELKRAFRWQKGIFRELFKLGLPIGAQMIMEVGAFSVGAIMVGMLGAASLAAHQIALGMAALTYMMANGLAAATTIRTSNYMGEKMPHRAARAVWSSYHLVIGFMAISAVGFILGKRFLPSLYIDNIEVIDIAARLMVIAAFFQLFDGIQVIALGALRGMQDVKIPTGMAMISYWILALPSSYIYAFLLDLGPEGVWYGYLTGLGAASVLLTLRVKWLLGKKLSVLGGLATG